MDPHCLQPLLPFIFPANQGHMSIDFNGVLSVPQATKKRKDQCLNSKRKMGTRRL